VLTRSCSPSTVGRNSGRAGRLLGQLGDDEPHWVTGREELGWHQGKRARAGRSWVLGPAALGEELVTQDWEKRSGRS
jgi:hypothetical protein